MSDEKEPAISATAAAIVEQMRVGLVTEYDGFELARRFDAWGEALLKRQAEASEGAGDYCQMTDSQKERLYLETTEANCIRRFPYCDPLLAYREVKRWRDMQHRTYEDGSALLERFETEKVAHTATRAELEAARKELDSAKAQGDFYRDNGRLAIEQRAELRAELESLRKPLEGELAMDVATVRHWLIEAGAGDISHAALDRLAEAALRAKWAELEACGELNTKLTAALLDEKTRNASEGWVKYLPGFCEKARGEPHSETLQALANMGHDTECGACMGVAFTGHAATEPHTCKAKGEPQTAAPIGSALDVERMARTGEVAEPPEPRCSCRSAPMGSTFCDDCKHDRGCPVHNSDRCKTRGRVQGATEPRPIVVKESSDG